MKARTEIVHGDAHAERLEAAQDRQRELLPRAIRASGKPNANARLRAQFLSAFPETHAPNSTTSAMTLHFKPRRARTTDPSRRHFPSGVLKAVSNRSDGPRAKNVGGYEKAATGRLRVRCVLIPTKRRVF
jgi:hypothetical protein